MADTHLLVCYVMACKEAFASMSSFLAPQVFDNYAVTVMIGGEPYTLGLFDTAGNQAFFLVIVMN